jgi:hypothetical protein
MKSKGYEARWRRSFVEERVATARVAAEFLAEQYGNPQEDLIDLVYYREADCFTTVTTDPWRVVAVGDVHLNEEIEDFMRAHPMLGPFVRSWDVFNMLKGMCGWWAEGTRIEVPAMPEFPEAEGLRLVEDGGRDA